MKKRILRIIAILIGIILLAGTLLGAAELAVRSQPVVKTAAQAAELATSSPWVKVQVDEGMFTLFAALNMAGYDRDNFNMPYHPVRQQVRQWLSGRTFSGLERLRFELGFINPYNFVVYLLHYGPPPEFARRESQWSGQGPAFFFLGLDGLLGDFYREMDIASLWQEVLPQVQAEAARYQQAAGQAVDTALAYTRMKDVPLKKVVVIPNLLDAHWSGFGPQIGQTAYAVIGPTQEKPDTGLVMHETMHSIAGPLVEASLKVIEPAQSRRLYAILSQRVPAGYGSWDIVVEEQVVRALDCRLAGQACQEYLLKQDEQAGFLLEPALVEKLAEFESGQATLAEFMPDLLKTINGVDLAGK